MKEFKEFVSVVRAVMFTFGVAGLAAVQLVTTVLTVSGVLAYFLGSYLAWGLIVSAIVRPRWRVVLAWGLMGWSRRVREWCGVPG